MSKEDDFELFILSTLSFYEEMSFSKILFDLNPDELKKFRDFSNVDLEVLLIKLQKKGLIRAIKNNDEIRYLRVHRQKTLFDRLKSFFKSL